MVTHGRIQPVRLFDEEDEEDEEEEEEEEKEGPLGQLGHARALLVDLHRYGRGLDRHALEGIVGPQLSEHLGEIWDPFAVLGPSPLCPRRAGRTRARASHGPGDALVVLLREDIDISVEAGFRRHGDLDRVGVSLEVARLELTVA